MRSGADQGCMYSPCDPVLKPGDTQSRIGFHPTLGQQGDIHGAGAQLPQGLPHILIQRRDLRRIQFQGQQRRAASQACAAAAADPVPALRSAFACASSQAMATSAGGGANVNRRQRLAMVAGKRWLGLAIMINTVFAVGSSSVFRKALAPFALSASAPSMTPTL